MRLYNKHTFLLLSLCAALSACGDKENEVINVVPEPEPEPVVVKTPISLSVGGMDGAMTRAVVTDKVSSKTFTPLAPDTYIYMWMKSEYVELAAPNGYEGAKDVKYAITRGESFATTDEETNGVSMTEGRVRYWDDAHARCSNISVLAVACSGLNYLGGIGTNYTDSNNPFTKGALTQWTTTSQEPVVEWNVPNGSGSAQDETSLKNRDLLFSNNVANYSTASVTDDRRLKFKTETKKFDKGDLVFYHALSKITVNVWMGDGYSSSDAFEFKGSATTENISLSYFNIRGKFDVAQGEFSQVNYPSEGKDGHAIIASMWNHSATPNKSDDTKPAYTLEALVLPYLSTDSKPIKGSIFDNTDNVALEFYIDNSKFQLTRKQLLKALTENSVNSVIVDDDGQIKMEAGKNYVFSFRVGKTKVHDMTATVAEWEDVVADEITPSNARIKLNLEEREGDKTSLVTSNLTFYRSIYEYDGTTIQDNVADYDEHWMTGYTGSGNMVSDAGSSPTAQYKAATGTTLAHWEPSNWYWMDNKTFCHFRALTPNNLSVTAKTDATAGDNVTLTAGASYSDVCWGAPFLDVVEGNETDDRATLTWNYDPEKYGFDGKKADVEGSPAKHQIYKAIGPTEDPIKLIMFHMMSELKIILSTSTGDDGVKLVDGEKKTKVELIGESKTGTLMLGNGFVEASTTDKSSETSPTVISTAVSSQCSYGVIPQDLTGIKLRISTPDNNEYIVDLKNRNATVTNTHINNPYTPVVGTTNKYVIDRWYPGYKYTYSFVLKKKGTFELQATVLNWEIVEADPDDVTIK